MVSAKQFDTIVIGAGPAGTGPLVAAAQHGLAPNFLRRGILWVDETAHMGQGSLPKYAIPSDTMAKVLLESLQGSNNPLAALSNHQLTRHMSALGEKAVPLVLAGQYLALVGESLQQLIVHEPASDFWPQHRAVSVRLLEDHTFLVTFESGRQAHGQKLVLALGGYQDQKATLETKIAEGMKVQDINPERLMLSGELFAHGGLERASEILKKGHQPIQIGILGGSHSAVCAAEQLIHSPLLPQLKEGSVKIWCREPPRPFYASEKAAQEEGFSDYTSRDICPVTGRVFRLAGLRMASRDLLRSILQLGDSPPENRVLIRSLITSEPQEIQQSLLGADLVISCLGYRPKTLAFYDDRNPTRRLSAGATFATPRVDSSCRLLDADGTVIPNAFGIGLASGFVPSGPILGGEPSFRGQTNGIWLYQHDLGRLILQQLGFLI